MKKAIVIVVGLLALSAGAWAGSITLLGTYDVSANSTFLARSSNDNCGDTMGEPCTPGEFAPTILAVTPGETLQIIITGDTACYGGTDTAYCVSSLTDPPPAGGMFDATNTDVLPSYSNSINSGLPNITDTNFNQYYGGASTVLPNDFYVCGTNAQMMDCTGDTTGTIVKVPTGANYLYLGALDSFYADNSGSLTITVNEILSPEPGTWAMMLGGFALLAVLYRLRAAASR